MERSKNEIQTFIELVNNYHATIKYRPSVPNLRNILMSKWHLIENQPLLREIYKNTFVQIREIFERRTRKSKALKVTYFLSLISTNRSPVWPVFIIFSVI